MTKKNILHMVTPLENVSAFDANMAVDAGYDVIVPHTGVGADKVGDVVQDAIFSRPPGTIRQSGIFLGGYDIDLAADMFKAAAAAVVPPFELSIFTDPNGAYTTSAALVAVAEKLLKDKSNKTLEGCRARVFGGGPVGLSAAILLAKAGAEVGVAKLTNSPRSAPLKDLSERYGVRLQHWDAQDDELKVKCLEGCELLFATAKEGIQVVSSAVLDSAQALVVAADVNAVPPAGIEGIDVMASGTEINTANGSLVTVGALGVGKVKYDLQKGLFEDMLSTDKPLRIDFPAAFERARQLVG